MILELDPRRTALVLIDLQNGIVAMPLQPHSAESVVHNARRMADSFRKRAAEVIYVRVDLADMQPLAVDVSHVDPSALPPPPIASEIVPAAGYQESDLLLTKRHWGAFSPVSLQQILQRQEVDTIVLAGLVTNFGVESSARQAVGYGLNVVIVEDACSALDSSAHRFAFENIFPLMARVRKTQDVISAIERG